MHMALLDSYDQQRLLLLLVLTCFSCLLRFRLLWLLCLFVSGGKETPRILEEATLALPGFAAPPRESWKSQRGLFQDSRGLLFGAAGVAKRAGAPTITKVLPAITKVLTAIRTVLTALKKVLPVITRFSVFLNLFSLCPFSETNKGALFHPEIGLIWPNERKNWCLVLCVDILRGRPSGAA